MSTGRPAGGCASYLPAVTRVSAVSREKCVKQSFDPSLDPSLEPSLDTSPDTSLRHAPFDPSLGDHWATVGRATIGRSLGDPGATIGRPLGDHWGTVGRPLRDRWATIGRPLGDPLGDPLNDPCVCVCVCRLLIFGMMFSSTKNVSTLYHHHKEAPANHVTVHRTCCRALATQVTVHRD